MEKQDFKIKADKVSELENDYHTIWAKVLLGADVEDAKKEISTLAELGEEWSIVTWYHMAQVGENEIIDNILKDYPLMSDQQAASRIYDYADELQKTTDEARKQEILKEIEFLNKCLIKSSQNVKEKIQTKKELKDFFTSVVRFKGKEECVLDFERIKQQDEVDILEIRDVINAIVFNKIKLDDQHKKLLKEVSKRPFCDKVQEYISLNQNGFSV